MSCDGTSHLQEIKHVVYCRNLSLWWFLVFHVPVTDFRRQFPHVLHTQHLSFIPLKPFPRFCSLRCLLTPQLGCFLMRQKRSIIYQKKKLLWLPLTARFQVAGKMPSLHRCESVLLCIFLQVGNCGGPKRPKVRDLEFVSHSFKVIVLLPRTKLRPPSCELESGLLKLVVNRCGKLLDLLLLD